MIAALSELYSAYGGDMKQVFDAPRFTKPQTIFQLSPQPRIIHHPTTPIIPPPTAHYPPTYHHQVFEALGEDPTKAIKHPPRSVQ